MSKYMMTIGILLAMLFCVPSVWAERDGAERKTETPVHGQANERTKAKAKATTPEPAKAEVDDVGQGGEISWSWSEGTENWPAEKVKAIEAAMNEAVAFYNRHTRLRKHVTVEYNAKVSTANANIRGHIRFGGSISSRTALHELSHTLGVGTARVYFRLLKDGKWTGPHAVSLIKAFDGPDAVLHGDKKHFWPYGLNYAKEDSPIARIRNVKLVEAMNWDMRVGHLMDAKDVKKDSK